MMLKMPETWKRCIWLQTAIFFSSIAYHVHQEGIDLVTCHLIDVLIDVT